MLFQALGLNFALTEVVKHAVPRPRPFIAFPSQGQHPARVAPDASASFWSGHTSGAFAAAAIGAFDACRVNGPLGCTVPAVGLHALAASTGLMRVLAGKHHVSDVLAGAAVGSAIGTAVALAHAPRGREGREAGQTVLGSQVAMLSMLWLW
jgi:membrane-associated phospholipid phosphatase